MGFFDCSTPSGLREKSSGCHVASSVSSSYPFMGSCENQSQTPWVLLAGEKKTKQQQFLSAGTAVLSSSPSLAPSVSLPPSSLLVSVSYIFITFPRRFFFPLFLFAPECSFSPSLSLSLSFSPSHSCLPACSPSFLSRCSLTPLLLLLLTRSHVVREGGKEGGRRWGWQKPDPLVSPVPLLAYEAPAPPTVCVLACVCCAVLEGRARCERMMHLIRCEESRKEWTVGSLGWWLGRVAVGGGLPLGEREREKAEAAQFAAEHASYWTPELHGSTEVSSEQYSRDIFFDNI